MEKLEDGLIDKKDDEDTGPVNLHALLRDRVRTWVFAIGITGITAMVLGDGIVQRIGSTIFHMWFGVLALGYLIDPIYLNQEGREKGLGARRKTKPAPPE